jgi:hypothetical protein
VQPNPIAGVPSQAAEPAKHTRGSCEDSARDPERTMKGTRGYNWRIYTRVCPRREEEPSVLIVGISEFLVEAEESPWVFHSKVNGIAT